MLMLQLTPTTKTPTIPTHTANSVRWLRDSMPRMQLRQLLPSNTLQHRLNRQHIRRIMPGIVRDSRVSRTFKFNKVVLLKDQVQVHMQVQEVQEDQLSLQ